MSANPPLHHVGIVQMSEEDVRAMMDLMGLEGDYRGYVERWSALCIFTKATSGSPIEFVVPDETGLVCEPTPDALAAAMDCLWEDRHAARALGEAGRARYRAMNISWPAVVERLVA